MTNLIRSSTKGRCRSTAFTIAGYHQSKAIKVLVTWPGTTEPVRVRRDKNGEITSLGGRGDILGRDGVPLDVNLHGEIFTLQHVNDSDKLAELFEQEGVVWDKTGVVLHERDSKRWRGFKILEEQWGTTTITTDVDQIDAEAEARRFEEALKQGAITSLDKNMLEGNYPEGMPEHVKKHIGHIMETYTKAPGIGKKELRQARNYLIHKHWELDRQNTSKKLLGEKEARAYLTRFCPGLYVCELPEPLLQIMNNMWNNPTYDGNMKNRIEFRRHGIKHGISSELQETLQRDIETLAELYSSKRKKARTTNGHHEFETFMKLMVRVNADVGRAEQIGPASRRNAFLKPDGKRLYSWGIEASLGYMSEEHPLISEVESMVTLATAAVLEAKPIPLQPGDLWCQRCRGKCRCPQGKKALDACTDVDSDWGALEHRWTANNCVKATARVKKEAQQNLEKVQTRVKELVGEPTYKNWEQRYGDGLAEDISLMLVQMNAKPEDLGGIHLQKLESELAAIEDRISGAHNGWAKRVQELEELTFDGPKTAVFLGRDGIYGYWAFQELVAAGKIDAENLQGVYVSASRAAIGRTLKKLKRLSDTGKDLVYVDTGFQGTIPKRIDKELFDNAGDRQRPAGELDDAEEAVLKTAHIRLLSSNDPRLKFAEDIDHDTAVTVEHDAKENYSGSAAVIGKDGGGVTSAFEQFVARRLEKAIRASARQEADQMTPLAELEKAHAYYTKDAIGRLKGLGLDDAQITESGRLGLSILEAVKRHRKTLVETGHRFRVASQTEVGQTVAEPLVGAGV